MSDGPSRAIIQDPSPDRETPGSTAASSPPRESVSRERRRIWWLLAAIAVALVLAMAGGVGWMRYAATPQYSLAQLENAARGRDWAGVQKYIDFDAIASDLIAGVTAKVTAQDSSGSGALGASMAQRMKPAFVRQLKDGLKKSVEGGGTQQTGGLSGLLVAKEPKSVTFVGDKALVTVAVPSSGGGAQELKLTMKKVGDLWRIVALETSASPAASSTGN